MNEEKQQNGYRERTETTGTGRTRASERRERDGTLKVYWPQGLNLSVGIEAVAFEAEFEENFGMLPREL
jgi:hypothetical protein